jgi:hypothetical protein
MRRILSLIAVALALPMSASAADKGVAVIANTDAAGIQTGTEVQRDILGECILKLPNEAQFAPVSTSKDVYLHKIDGTDKKGYVQVWTSTINLGWQVKQRYMYVVSTKGIGQTAAPQMKEETAQFFRSEEVVSDAGESQHVASNQGPVRYFATAQEAEASVRRRAAARIKELQANLCAP